MKAVTVMLMLLFAVLSVGVVRAFEYIMEFDQRRQGAIACAILVALVLAIYYFMSVLVRKATKS